jgi:hypothetical protein
MQQRQAPVYDVFKEREDQQRRRRDALRIGTFSNSPPP